MKLKNLKKIVKKNLFNKSMSQNFFMVFEINNVTEKSLKVSFESNNFFSKDILNKSLSQIFTNLKYPIIIRSTFSLDTIFNYISNLRNKNLICNIFFIKIYFLLFKKNKSNLICRFDRRKNLFLFNMLQVCLIKKKKLLKLVHTLICPFINLDHSNDNLLNK